MLFKDFLNTCGKQEIAGGQQMWGEIGTTMGNIGINFMPVFWGFMASIAEFGGGLLILLGVFYRSALAMMIFTMFIASLMHYNNGDGFGGYSHAVESMIVFIGLFVAGAGNIKLKLR